MLAFASMTRCFWGAGCTGPEPAPLHAIRLNAFNRRAVACAPAAHLDTRAALAEAERLDGLDGIPWLEGGAHEHCGARAAIEGVLEEQRELRVREGHVARLALGTQLAAGDELLDGNQWQSVAISGN